jgi:mortality factor 4-like protein 1
MSDEEEMIDDGDDDEEEYNNQSIEPIIDVLQIDNELSSTKYRFKKNEIMLCYHGLLLYEVKCVDHKIKENDSGNFHRPSYLVHYCGWSSKWDEWVDETRLVKMDEHGLKKQAQLLLQHGKGKARLKNLRKNNSTSPLKRTTSRSISDYSTSTNMDEITNNNNNNNEETRSLSGRSDTGSSSSSITSELISNTDSVITNNDINEPDVKKFKRNLNSSGKILTKDKTKIESTTSTIINDLSPSISAQYETCQRLTRRYYSYQMEWLQFPSDLVEYLINDRDLINNQNNLLSIPPNDSSLIIRHIFKNYLDQQFNECSLAEVLAIKTLISSLIEMFNIALGKCLLYRFERLQLKQLLEKDSSISLCDYYGSIHLLRFFWRIKDFLREMSANTNREEFGLLLGRIQHFLNYLYENKTILFPSSEYDICSTEYYRCSLQCFQ